MGMNEAPSSKYLLADGTLKLLEATLRDGTFADGKQMFNELEEMGKKMFYQQHRDIVVLNVILRVLKVIQEEAHRLVRGQPEFDEDITNQLFAQPIDILPRASGDELKEAVLVSIGELEMEFRNAEENIASQALEHIHTDELILTIGYSRTVASFLKMAVRKKRRFNVIIVKTDDDTSAEPIAYALSQLGNCKVTVIVQSAVFAVMARVNKVLIGPDAIFADGSFRATCGAYATASAAKHYCVPVILCTPMYKFTPLWTYRSVQGDTGNPNKLLPDWLGRNCSVVHNPQWDIVPSGMVSIIVTNSGAFAPSYVYRQINENFKNEHVIMLTNESVVDEGRLE